MRKKKRNRIYMYIMIGFLLFGATLLIVGYAISGVPIIQLLTSNTAIWVYVAGGLILLTWAYLSIVEKIRQL